MDKALKITEGVSGTHFYHLSAATEPTKALCGAWVMGTHLPLQTWGEKTHIRERYCEKCSTLAQTSKGA